MSAGDLVAAVVHVAEVDALASRAVEDGLPVRFPEPLVRSVDIESVVSRKRLEHVEVVDVSPVPAPYRAFRQGQVRVGDHQVGIEVLLDAKAVAGRAGPCRVVEGEHARLEFADAVAALGAGETGAEGQVVAIIGVEEADNRDVLAELKGRLERFREALLGIGANPEAIHDRLDGVLPVLVEIRGMVEIGDDAVDAGADEAVRG